MGSKYGDVIYEITGQVPQALNARFLILHLNEENVWVWHVYDAWPVTYQKLPVGHEVLRESELIFGAFSTDLCITGAYKRWFN